MNGGLAQISPMALSNFLRILLIRLKDFRWQSGEITKNIPEIHASEWPKILSHCTEQEFQFLINIKGDSKEAMPNQVTGRKTPIQEYYQYLNNSFQAKVKESHLTTP